MKNDSPFDILHSAFYIRRSTFYVLRSLRLVDVRRLAEEHFGSFHQRFGERRMRVDRKLQIRRGGAHLDRDNGLGDELAGAAADEADTQDAFRRRIDQQLGEAV